MPTPINNKGCRSGFNAIGDFHAGHFLRSLLQEQGHDVPWLALQPLFMQRVDEMIFGKDIVARNYLIIQENA